MRSLPEERVVSFARRRALSWPLAWAAASWVPVASAQTRNGFDLAGALVPVDEILPGGPPKDGIPAIDDPSFVRAGEARFQSASDRVLGVVRGGVAKAYPLPILNWHEVVNDRFGDEPVVVTYCPLCGTGMSFVSRVDGQAVTFGVSGLLYQSDVLLYDRRTSSLWSQIMAKAVTGPHRGRPLEMVTTDHTTWQDWRQRHPSTLVLAPPRGHGRDYSRNPYQGYERSAELFFPVKFRAAGYHPKERVVGVRLAAGAKAYPFSELARAKGDVRDRIGAQEIVVSFDATHATARVRDAAGRDIPSVIAFWFAWYAFHPQTAIHRAR